MKLTLDQQRDCRRTSLPVQLDQTNSFFTPKKCFLNNQGCDGGLPDLPSDIIFEILLWLPVRSLRFKCDCKSWFLFISNPNFAKKHFKSQKENPKQHIERLFFISGSDDCYSVDLESSYLNPEQLKFRGEQDPIKFDRVLGTCDGLLLLSYLHVSLFLVNPSNGESKELPQPPNFIALRSDLYGFRYDSSIDDYKVVIISLVEPHLETNENRVDVYNLRANSWRRIKSCPVEFYVFQMLTGSFSMGLFIGMVCLRMRVLHHLI